LIAGLLGLSTAWFWPVLFGTKTLVPFDILFNYPPFSAFAPQFGVGSPHNPLLADLVLENFVWKRFIMEALQTRQLPLWNPYLFAGIPFLAAGQHSALYPLSIIYYVLPLSQAYGLFTVVQLWLAGVCAYIFARVSRLSRISAAFISLTWMFSGPLIAQVVFPMIVATLSWLPALLTVVELLVQGEEAQTNTGAPANVSTGLGWLPGSRALLVLTAGSVVVGLQFLAGHVEIAIYLILITAFYGLWRLISLWQHTADWRRPVRLLFWLGSMGGVGTALAGVQIIPLLELVQLNFRQDSASYSQVIGWAYKPWQLITFFIPDFFGNPSHHQVYDIFARAWAEIPARTTEWDFRGVKNYVEAASYVGILPLLLAASAVIQAFGTPALAGAADRLKPAFPASFFAALAGLSLLFIFGTPAYALLYYGLPGISQAHTPFRWVFPYAFSVAMLGGIGLESFIKFQTPNPKSQVGRWPLTVGICALVIGIGLLALLALSLAVPNPALAVAERVLRSAPGAAQTFGDPRLFFSFQFGNLLHFALFLASSGLAILLLAARPDRSSRLVRSRLWLLALPFVVIILDLALLFRDFNPAADPKLATFTPPSVEFLKQDRDLYRITSFGEGDILWPNTGMLYDLADMRGYDSIIPKQYVTFINAIEDQSGMLLYNRIAPLRKAQSLDSPLLDLLNVKYVLTMDRIDRSGWTLVYDDEIRIYRNDDVLPRAFFAGEDPRNLRHPANAAELKEQLKTFDPRQVVLLDLLPERLPNIPAVSAPAPGNRLHIDHYTPNEVRLTAERTRPAFLILTDSYFPGWKAFLAPFGPSGPEAEIEVPIFRADGNFRAILVPAGRYAVRFVYSPMSVKLGAYTSFLAVVVMLLGLGYWLWGRIYQPAHEGETVRRVAKNSLAPMMTSLVNKAIDFAFAAFMLRILGPTLSGRYYFAALGVVGYVEIFTNFGLNLLLTREVAKDRRQANRYLSNTIMLRLGLWLVSIIPLAIFCVAWRTLFDLPDDTAQAILLLTLALIPGNLAAALSSLFYAYERMEIPAAITTLTTLFKVSLGALVLLSGWGFVGLAGVAVVNNVLTALMLYRIASTTFFRPRLEIDRVLIWGMLGVSFPLMLNHLLNTLFFKLDVTLLQPLQGDTVVGWYSTAYKWIDALLIIPAYSTMAIFPLISRYAGDARDSLVRAYVLALRLLLMVALPIAMATTFIAEPLIALLGGPEFLPHGAIALQIMIWFLPFSFANGVTQYVLIAIDRQRWITVSFAIATTFNLIANLIFIPRFGYPAAAAITILSELVLFVPFYTSIRRNLAPLPLVEILWRPIAAAGLMGIVLWALGSLSFALSLPIAGAIYLAALMMLGAFTAEDRILAWRLLPKSWRPVETAEGV